MNQLRVTFPFENGMEVREKKRQCSDPHSGRMVVGVLMSFKRNQKIMYQKSQRWQEEQ